jgi:cation transport ATPase
MDTLIAMGSLAAYLYSVIVLLGILFGFAESVGDHVYFETAAVSTLITLGKHRSTRQRTHQRGNQKADGSRAKNGNTAA